MRNLVKQRGPGFLACPVLFRLRSPMWQICV